MRKVGLIDRLRVPEGGEGVTRARAEQAKLLEELARALREAALVAEQNRPQPLPPLDPLPTRNLRPEAMPQILQQRPPQLRPRQRRLKGKPGPALVGIAVGLAAVALLLIASMGEMIGLTSTPRTSATQEPQRATIAPIARIDPTTDLSGAAAEAEPTPTELSVDEYALLARAEALIARGDILGARAMLARAAAQGNRAVRFALAETFDPNMLAAWGARHPAADPALARDLYGKALAAGDGRAKRRLEALGEP